MKRLLLASAALFLLLGCISAESLGDKIIGAVYTGKYERTDHNTVFGINFDMDGDGAMEYISVEEWDDNRCDAEWIWHGDGFTLKIEPNENESFTPIEEEFNSSYGQYVLEAYDLFHDNRGELFLVSGVMRGTELRAEGLEIKRWENGNLKTIFTHDISGHIHPARIFYQRRYEVLDVNGDGFEDLAFITDYEFNEVNLTDKEKADILNTEECKFLKKRVEVFLWDKSKGEYVLSESK